MKQAYIFNTGCVRRALDCTKISNYLTMNNWGFTEKISSADLVIIATCGTVQKLEDISLTAIKKISKKSSDSAKVIITGCLSKINPDNLSDFNSERYALSTFLTKIRKGLKTIKKKR